MISNQKIILADTHCHLDFPEYDSDRKDVIARAKEAGVNYIINVGSSIEGSRSAVKLAEEFDSLWAVVGVHPHEADGVGQDVKAVIRDLACRKKIVAIGEIGLDYFKNFSKPENQRPLFISLLELAKELNLPVVLHTRDAAEDTINILKSFMPIKAVVHCFSGDENFLKVCLDMGFFVSFTCNITYKKADKLREVLQKCPLERLMLETDCPYLSPEGFRGKRNEPFQVRLLAEGIAKIKQVTLEEVAQNSTKNALEFFRIK